MADWYYSEGGAQKGPVSDDQLRALIASGQLQARDSVWRQGMADWAKISTIPELAPPRGDDRRGRGDDEGVRARGRGDDSRERGRRDDHDRDYDARPTRRRGGVSKVTIWSILILAGAVLWLANFFLPWWGMTATQPSPDAKLDVEALMRAERALREMGRSNQDWHDKHIPQSKKDSFERQAREMGRERRGGSVSLTLLGFNTGTGLFAFIVSIVILGAVIPTLFVRILAEWRWTGTFVFAILAIVLLIFGMLWLFGAPEADARPLMSQGKIIGPYVHLVGCLLVLVGGVLEGIFGLLALLKRSRG